MQSKIFRKPKISKVLDEMKRGFHYPNGARIFTGDVLLVCEQCGPVSLNLEKILRVNIFGFRNGRRCSMDVLQEKVGPNVPNFLPLPRFVTRSVSMEFELN